MTSFQALDTPSPNLPPTDPGASASARAAREGGTVMAYTEGMRGFSSQHEQLTRMEIVRRLAQLKRYRPGDELSRPVGRVYLVPSDTLVSGHAAALGVSGCDDLFGGVVPHAFIATKAISHPLVSVDAAAPQGWRHDFHAAIATTVLRGYSAFSRADARLAGCLLLQQDQVARIKRVCETGGRGQTVVRSQADLDACLNQIDDESLQRDGLVIEQNLAPVRTLSVGQVVVAGITASYHGTQQLTRNNHGKEVYAGSELTVVRGEMAALLDQDLAPQVRVAVAQAIAYDSAVTAFYPDFFASRTNYDIAQGQDAGGEQHSGVLEQSWRVGGATGAEIAALEVLAADPSRNLVRTRCVEAYGPAVSVPPGGTVYFQGVDDRLGAMTKFALVLSDGDAA